MNYSKIRKYLSSARLLRYEQVCANDQRKALKLYQANLRLSQAFYPLLSLFEVILRNALNDELINHFSDSDWLKNQRNIFMSHSNLTYTHPRTQRVTINNFLKKSVNKVLNNNGVGVSHGKIVADLNLGFWSSLFETTHYSILQGVPIRIFSTLPTGINRNHVNQKIKKIRTFRNRIYHNEPIIFNNNPQNQTIIDLTSANQVHNDIKDIFSWLGLEYCVWTKKINDIDFEIKRTNYVISKYPKITYYFKRIEIGFILYKERYLKN